MGLLNSLLKWLPRLGSGSTSCAQYVFYKIVDTCDEKDYFTLQCINTSALFYLTLEEMIADVDIIYSLHPVQACFVGIEYTKLMQQRANQTRCRDNALVRYQQHRYGRYQIVAQDRARNITFIDSQSQVGYTMDPRDIALTEALISEFDAVQAFYIGQLAGVQIHNPVPAKPSQQRHLRLVK